MDASNVEGSQTTKTRLAFAGLKAGEYGSFDYGRNYGAIYDVEAATDMLVEWGGDGWNYTDNYMTGRTNGVATYRNSDFFGLVDGLSFALQYQGKRPRPCDSQAEWRRLQHRSHLRVRQRYRTVCRLLQL